MNIQSFVLETQNKLNSIEYRLQSIGGGGGAPTNAQYVTMALNATLTAERVLMAGDNITITDGGAGGSVTVKVDDAGWTTYAILRTAATTDLIANSSVFSCIANGDVGIGLNNPIYSLHVYRNGANAAIIAERNGGAQNFINATNTHGNFGTINNFPLRLIVNSTWRALLDANNNLGMRLAAFGANADTVFGIASGTAPTSSPVNAAQLWVEDINAAAGKAGFHMRTENSDSLIVPGVVYKTTTGDPAYNFEGLFCINTFDNNFKVYAEGVWRTLVSW